MNIAHELQFCGEGVEIVRIAKDGRLFWRQREVETDDDFRAAMMDLAENLSPLHNPAVRYVSVH